MSSEIYSNILELIQDMDNILSAHLLEPSAEPSATVSKLSGAFESIGLAAGEHELPGLQDVCLLLHERMIDIGTDNFQLTSEQQNLVAEWPVLVRNYLNHPGEQEPVAALIGHLQSGDWPSQIRDEEAAMIREMLLSAPDAGHSRLETSANDIGGLLKLLEQQIGTYSEEGLEDLQSIAESAEQLGLLVSDMGFLGLQDICVLVQENLSDLHAKREPLTDAQNILLVSWLGLTNKYINGSSATDVAYALIKNVCNRHWPSALNSADAKVLTRMMNVKWEEIEHEILNYQGDGMVVAELDGTKAWASPEMLNVVQPVDESDPELTRAVSQDDVEPANQIDDEEIVSVWSKLREAPVLSPDTSVAGPGEEQFIVDTPAAPVPVISDLVEMLLAEIGRMSDEAQAVLDILNNDSAEEIAHADALSKFALHVERFGSACQAADLDGLYQVSNILYNNLNMLVSAAGKPTKQQTDAIFIWPQQIENYLKFLGNPDASHAIVNVLQLQEWPEPLIQELSPALLDLLNAPYLVDERDVIHEARKAVASVEDVSLRLPDDINRELLDGLLQELPGQTEEFSAAIQALIDGQGGMEEVTKAQRIAHTVKGAANTVGVVGIASLTHHLEDIFSALNENSRLPSQLLAATLMEAADCLEEMSESLLKQDDAPAAAQRILQDVLDWINRIEMEGISILDDDIKVADDLGPSPTGTQAAEMDKEEQAAVQMLRVPAPVIDELMRLVGETIILNSQLSEKIKSSTEQNQLLLENNTMLRNLVSDLERNIEIHGGLYSEKIAVNQGEVFDSLELERYNELHTVSNQLAEIATDIYELNRDIQGGLGDLDELLVNQSHLHKEVHDMVIQTRMVPIRTITPRLQRSFRQTCRITGKIANLHLQGIETLIDSDVLNNLIDPLMHMLRNAVDHGIESREVREANGKQPEGSVRLEFYRDGTQVVVRCEDDGAGLDIDAIKEIAGKRGMIDEGEREYSDAEINRLILQPGFSTRSKTTQTSGRGIGLDVVYTQLLAVKGAMQIESNKGKGCAFELRLPVTLMTTHALIIRYRQQSLAISSRGIEQIINPGDSELVETENGIKCQVGDETFDTDTIENLLNLPDDRRLQEREHKLALLVRGGDVDKVVFIQELTDTRDLIVKSMGKYLKDIRGILGATIFGDGSVVPVLDIPELIRLPHERHGEFSDDLSGVDAAEPLLTALVVDDSLSARRSLAQVIKDAGYNVRTAKDGLEALAVIDSIRPDILLVDMEMPRMNGIELTTHIRGTVDIKNIPIIMVTSRSTEKHRKIAAGAGVDIYMTKPFSEDEMLANVHKLLN